MIASRSPAAEQKDQDAANREERPVRNSLLARTEAFADEDGRREDAARQERDQDCRDDGSAEDGSEQRGELDVAHPHAGGNDEQRQKKEQRRARRREDPLEG